jgi:hypothetical protein
MRWLAALRWFAGILGIAAALLTSAPAQADRDCPNGQITSQDCTGDNCGPVQTRCVPPRPELPQTWLPVEVQLGVGVGVGF